MLTPNPDQIASELNAQYSRPITISVMRRLDEWPFLQTLGFQASLKDSSEMFHGLEDFVEQIEDYSSANPTQLGGPMSVIAPRAPLNANVEREMYEDPTLGEVGLTFESLAGFGQVFAVSPDELQESPTAAADKVTSSGSGS
jgi:hypothetical protein